MMRPAVSFGLVVCGLVGAALVPAAGAGADEAPPPSTTAVASGFDPEGIGAFTRTTGRLAAPDDPVAGSAAACTPGHSGQVLYDEASSTARPNLFQVRITTSCAGVLDVAFDFAFYGPWPAELAAAVLELDVDARFGSG